MAPEQMREEPYTTAVDIYAFGVILWQMLVGKTKPFCHLPSADVRVMVKAGNRPDLPLFVDEPGVVGGTVWDLIRACWLQAPEERPSIDSVIEQLASLGAQTTTTTRPKLSAAAMTKDDDDAAAAAVAPITGPTA
jgi:serine/threonine protein kinase